jgi:hypothetical protein
MRPDLWTFLASLLYGAHDRPTGVCRFYRANDGAWFDLDFTGAPTFVVTRVGAA